MAVAKRTVCILGGGIGGVVAANRLKKRLGSTARIILIDKNPDHVFQPSFLNVLVGKRRPEQIKRSLGRLQRKGIDFIRGEVTGIVPDQNLVKMVDQELSYDYLIIALGAEPNMRAVQGLREAAINLYSLEGILKIKETVGEFNGGEVVILIPSKPYKCPAAPYEAAFLLDAEFRRRDVRHRVGISIYTFEPLPMPTAGPEIGRAIKRFLVHRGINFAPGLTIETVNALTKEVRWVNGTTKKADLLITVPPHKAPEPVKKAGLVNEAGWIPVDPKTLQTQHDNIFAIGDVTAIGLEGRYKSDNPLALPKAGVIAHHQAEVVAANLAVEIRSTGRRQQFDGKGSCFLELGDGRAGYAAGSFYDRPHPQVRMRNPSRLWHISRGLYERYWFWRWF
jgi:sulfide:quinone oxidoreductase